MSELLGKGIATALAIWSVYTATNAHEVGALAICAMLWACTLWITAS